MKKLIKRILITFVILLLIGGSLLIYSIYIEPFRLTVERAELKVPNWSEKLNGLKVVAISDIHGGSHSVSEERLRQVVELANAQNPDLIVLLGDYISEVDFRRRRRNVPEGQDRTDLRMPVEAIAENLKGFQAKYGVFAVIGNHDHWHNQTKITGEFERVGIKTLENETQPIKINDETVWIWGIEDLWKRGRVPTEVLQKMPEKQNLIAITHNPDSLLRTPPQISVMFAGHSHGGQVKFPIYGAHPFVNDRRFMEGHAEVEGKHVFVTTGVGTTGPPIRFRVPPEIAVVQLYAQ